jgi:hypothetical protein
MVRLAYDIFVGSIEHVLASIILPNQRLQDVLI